MDGLGSGEEQAEAKAFVAQAFADRCWQTAPVRAPSSRLQRRQLRS